MPLQSPNSIVNTAASPASAHWPDLAPVPATALAPAPLPAPDLAPALSDIHVIAHSIIRCSQLSDPQSEMKHVH